MTLNVEETATNGNDGGPADTIWLPTTFEPQSFQVGWDATYELCVLGFRDALGNPVSSLVTPEPGNCGCGCRVRVAVGTGLRDHDAGSRPWCSASGGHRCGRGELAAPRNTI